MLSTLTGVAVTSQAFRTIAAVVSPDLQRDFGLSAEDLGVFAGAFHLSFALAQIPVGLALDLYGVRRTVAAAFSCTLLGTILSVIAPSLPLLVFGQLLIGLGCAPAFVGTLFFISKHFLDSRFAKVSGLVLSVSGLGLLATGTPLAWVVETWTWRTGFAIMGIFTSGILLATLVLVRDERSDKRADLRSATAEIGTILKKRHTIGILVLALVGYSSYMALRGLWAVPALIERYDFTLTQAGTVLLASSIAAMIAPPAFGLFSIDARRRRHLISGSVMASALAFAILALSSSWYIDAALCVALGFLTGFTVLQFADVKAAYAPRAVGRAFGIFNTATFLGVALMQWTTGQVAAVAGAHDIEQFAAVFSFIAVISVTAAIAFLLLPWPKPMT
ncbi:putative MFS family arabinose efflux permease [Pseudorhizobium tarimense]|uniref:MFS family arabinose efflux permease n=1 Tax=Pseudorhizobium tarimense TaxID=1079109 RepID=A0ABV2H881_9HYPH|nr:MFS transporter [Pseudorhizobium tarimense]MCJ8519731.1 MFS transporter [Pseudorhizobium tarimense]